MFAAVASVEQPGKTKDDLRGTRLIVGYGAVAVFLIVAMALSVTQGRDEHAPPAIAGFYASDSACLGERFSLPSRASSWISAAASKASCASRTAS